jgi:hypothetical protein
VVKKIWIISLKQTKILSWKGIFVFQFYPLISNFCWQKEVVAVSNENTHLKFSRVPSKNKEDTVMLILSLSGQLMMTLFVDSDLENEETQQKVFKGSFWKSKKAYNDGIGRR